MTGLSLASRGGPTFWGGLPIASNQVDGDEDLPPEEARPPQASRLQQVLTGGDNGSEAGGEDARMGMSWNQNRAAVASSVHASRGQLFRAPQRVLPGGGGALGGG